MSYTDKTLSCRDCGSSFVFTAGEQEFHEQKGFTNARAVAPIAAPRAKRRVASAAVAATAAALAKCTAQPVPACGKSCQVPFQPSGEKPVYCSDCFQGQRSSRPASRSTSRW